MPDKPERGFFKTKAVKRGCLAAMLIIPFGLYFAARSGSELGTYFFLGLMGLTMALAVKAG